jgi:primosomal protein N' (replication factor Y)
MFPQARLLRMDHDTTRTKNAHGQIFNQFKNYEADILIGTQMIAKGWDIPNVDLAGIINADAAFHLPDFRSTERNFSLLLQLIGRVGRHGGVGKIVLQTFETENPLWEILRKEDYQLFAFSELLERQKNNFPPFCQLVRLIFEHPENLICQRESLALFKKLNEQFAMQTANDLVEIMGPSPCFFERLHNKYRWHIILKGKNLRQFIKLAPKDWIVDVDPYSIL